MNILFIPKSHIYSYQYQSKKNRYIFYEQLYFINLIRLYQFHSTKLKPYEAKQKHDER